MTFDEWFSELEGWSFRSERAIADLGGDGEKVLLWLRAAYAVGYEHRKEEVPDEIT